MLRATCASVIEDIIKAAPFLEEVVRWNAFAGFLEDGILQWYVKQDSRMTPAFRQRMASLESLTPGGGIDLWLRAQVAAGGPKVFRPMLDQCLAMGEV